jgi:ubiquitin-like protein Nedd8
VENKCKIFYYKQIKFVTKCLKRADEMTASQYGIEGGSVLHLVLALRGGQ